MPQAMTSLTAVASRPTPSHSRAPLPTTTVSRISAQSAILPTPQILTLATETLVSIAKACEGSDLPNLRLVCRAFRDSSTETFGQVHLANLHVPLMRPSLEILAQITDHPIHSRHVKTIVCGTARTIKPETQYDDDEPLKSLKPSLRRLEGHIDMLAVALGNLKRHGNQNVALGIHDDGTWREGSGFSRLDSPISQKDPLVRADFDTSGTLRSLLEAASISKFPLNKKCFRFVSDLQHIMMNDTVHPSIFSAVGTLDPNTSISLDFLQPKSPSLCSIIIDIGKVNQLDMTSVRLEDQYWISTPELGVLRSALNVTQFDRLTLTDMQISSLTFRKVFANSKDCSTRVYHVDLLRGNSRSGFLR